MAKTNESKKNCTKNVSLFLSRFIEKKLRFIFIALSEKEKKAKEQVKTIIKKLLDYKFEQFTEFARNVMILITFTHRYFNNLMNFILLILEKNDKWTPDRMWNIVCCTQHIFKSMWWWDRNIFVFHNLNWNQTKAKKDTAQFHHQPNACYSKQSFSRDCRQNKHTYITRFVYWHRYE